VVITATKQKGKITAIDNFNRVSVLTADGFALQSSPGKLQPEGFSPVTQSAGADDRLKILKHELDPLPLGPFVKSKKAYRVGDSFQTATGENATVTEVVKGRVSYTFAGGSGVLLNG
jgi:hypothetical protein